MTNENYSDLSINNFIFKKIYSLSNESFEISKIKINNINYLFINTESPFILFFDYENKLIISNFNLKECQLIFNIKTFENYFLFMKKNQLILGNIIDSLSQNIISKPLNKQIYNLTYIEDYNFISFTSDEYSELSNFYPEEKKEKFLHQCKLNIIDKNLNEISSYLLDKPNEICHSFSIFDIFKNNSAENYIIQDNLTNKYDYPANSNKNKINSSPLIFILGTSIMTENQEPKLGYIIILEFNRFFRFTKLAEIEINSPIYKIGSVYNVIYTAVPSGLLAYRLEIKNLITNNLYDLKNATNINFFKNLYYDLSCFKDFSLELKEIRKCNEFNIIYDFIYHDDLILISDVNKSVCLYRFNKDKENFSELCKDYNPLFCLSINRSAQNIYTICDYNSNIYIIRKEVIQKDDIEKHKFDRISQINFGQKIIKQVSTMRQITKIEEEIFYPVKSNEIKVFNIFSDNSTHDSLYLTYFVTNEGTIGIILTINKDIFDYLKVLEKEILDIMEENRFNNENWRSIKDKFIVSKPKGFVDGNVLMEYLNFDEIFLKNFMKNLNYPWKKSIKETKKLIELFLTYH